MPIPPAELPEHSVEAGYILDLIAAANVALHGIDLKDIPQRRIDAEMLAEWSLVHRSSVALCRGQFLGLRRDVRAHDRPVQVIDAFVTCLRKGLEEGDLTKHLTQADIQTAHAAVRDISACTITRLFY